MATLDGAAVLGYAVHCREIPSATANQVASFFGLNGVVSLSGGSRGRVLEVTGVFFGNSISAINFAEAALQNFADGNVHTLADDRGRVYPYVIFRNEIQPDPTGPHPTSWNGGGWTLSYSAAFHSLT
jgi:hypothetical protein